MNVHNLTLQLPLALRTAILPRLRKLTLHPMQLTLAASVFLVLAYNFSFWKTFVVATGGLHASNIPLYLGAFTMLALVFNAFLSLVGFRYLLKPVLIVLFFVTAGASYFMNRYGIAIDAAMVQNVMETDPHEAEELLSWDLLFTLSLLGVLPSLFVYHVKLRYPSLTRSVVTNAIVVLLSVCAAGILMMTFFKTLAPAVREYREMRFLLTPTNVIQATNSYFKHHFAKPLVVEPMGRDAMKGKLWSQPPDHPTAGVQAPRRTVTIMVVGETARAMNFSLNGYSRDTNPLLSHQAGLINFKNVYSCGTATAISVPCLFSGMTREKYSEDKAKSQEGLLDVISHAGIDVLWRDNNSGCKGACDRVTYEDMSEVKAGDPFCGKDECYDERMLQGLPDIIRNARRDLVIVLHQKGSHGPAYWKRYPPAFQRFGPVCSSNELEKCSRESIVAAYDNTILYTDYFLSKTIDMLRAAGAESNVDTAMMYFSDHGESLGEKNMYLHGAPYIISPEEQRHVPFMLWLDQNFRDRFNIDQRCMEARRDQDFSHDNVFHSFLGMLNINTAVYNPQLDMFHACTLANQP
ncbi:phosphoethanolamine transferase [Duganella sp. FT27W]|uniref:phosphoethanolamine transferase n=1 Tax=Duganella sp. FT27W TaxID=2654636 RepID=UPI00135E536E|nr:phosphoethanolamine--lipid A transferase [Duganella sp. FT27W]